MHEGSLPELIVSDVYMDGIERAFPFWRTSAPGFPEKRIPFIFISADDTERMRLSGLQRGAVDYIVKPFSPEEIKNEDRHVAESVVRDYPG